MKNEVKKKMNAMYERCCTKVTVRRARATKSRPRYNETPLNDAIQRVEDTKTFVPVHLVRSQSHERMAEENHLTLVHRLRCQQHL
jgi:hypothetical protein